MSRSFDYAERQIAQSYCVAFLDICVGFWRCRYTESKHSASFDKVFEHLFFFLMYEQLCARLFDEFSVAAGVVRMAVRVYDEFEI